MNMIVPAILDHANDLEIHTLLHPDNLPNGIFTRPETTRHRLIDKYYMMMAGLILVAKIAAAEDARADRAEVVQPYRVEVKP
jgi:hypothetical protein